MDNTIIEEIAKQLGIAVDQAGQFITDYLPQYASLKAMQISVVMQVLGVITAISLVVGVAALSVALCSKKYDGDGLIVLGILTLIIFLVFGLVLATYAIFNVPQMIGWNDYPEAMLIDMALKAVS